MGTTSLDGEILTLDEVAAFLKAGKRTVYRFAQNGDIPAFKLGGLGASVAWNWIAGSIRIPASTAYMPLHGFTAVDLGYQQGNAVFH